MCYNISHSNIAMPLPTFICTNKTCQSSLTFYESNSTSTNLTITKTSHHHHTQQNLHSIILHQTPPVFRLYTSVKEGRKAQFKHIPGFVRKNKLASPPHLLKIELNVTNNKAKNNNTSPQQTTKSQCHRILHLLWIFHLPLFNQQKKYHTTLPFRTRFRFQLSD
jgi:hypothetical protein